MTARRLIVMRHATYSWIGGEVTDHQRPLNDSGRSQPPRIAAQLAEVGWLPEIVLSSDSRRTTETWQIMSERLPEARVTFDPDLYLAGSDALQRVVGAVAEPIQTVLVLGHNPGWEAVIEALSRVSVRMEPANAALLEGSGATWWDALASPWRLVRVLTP